MRGVFASLTMLVVAALSSVRADPPALDPTALRADEQALQRAGLKTDGATLLQFFRERTLSQAEQDQLGNQVKQLGANAYRTREQAMARLVKAGNRARALLRDALHNPDAEVARRAALCLRHIAASPDVVLAPAAARLMRRERPAGAAEVLLAYLPFADDTAAEEVRHALAAVALRDGQPDPILLQALGDPLPVKRAGAGDALACCGAPAARAVVLPLLKDPEASVRFQVGLALVNARDRHAVPVLIDLLDKLPDDQRWQIKDLLQEIAGEQAPEAAIAGISPAKERAVWGDWWKTHQDRVDLARLHDPANLLGYTLVTQMDNRTATGRVLEIDSGNKIRWQIDGLRYPVDAQVVGKDRVLIAEYLNRRVTERDFKGNILWEKQISLPIGCQRLPNGHTFIATRRQLLEVDRDGKEVFTYFHPTTSIGAARKLPDGQIVLVTSLGVCLRLDAAGKELKQFMAGPVYTMGSNIDLLPGGRVLVPQYRQNKVIEYDRDGNVVWEAKFQMPTSAVRLPNGHTLVVSNFQQRIVEINRDGQEVWQFGTDGRPWRARRR
jgi:HEAT repeats/PQQ-like domain